MRRYIAFAGARFYPDGGWHDFVGDYDTLDEAKSALASLRVDWRQVVDLTTGELVSEEP